MTLVGFEPTLLMEYILQDLNEMIRLNRSATASRVDLTAAVFRRSALVIRNLILLLSLQNQETTNKTITEQEKYNAARLS